jgi:TonB-linked SusC/RagA family outer membrane protein
MQITKVRRIALFMISMVLFSGMLFAQERTITGKVSTESEGPAPGVNVLIQGTMIGTITDLNGAYTIKVPNPEAVLVFSYIGYITEQVTVGTQAVIDVVLAADVVSLQEVVVTGYSTQRKRDITGAVGIVETTKLTSIPSGNVTNQLQGRTSGVTVTGSGQPGETAKVRIRGISSFQGNDPLYIVDGVPTQDISSMNPNDVESVAVLKDAGAASVYGSRASNGVIVVTTKKGGKGVKVNYDMFVGTQLPGAGPAKDLLNTQEYADLQWLVYKNDGTNAFGPDGVTPLDTHPIYGPSTNATPTLPAWAADTDWYDEFTAPAGTQNHDLSLSGGTDKAKYFAGFGYFSQDGIVMTTYNKRYSGRFNSEFTFLNDRVKIGENLSITYRNFLTVTNLGEGSPIQMGAYRSQPIIPVYITDPIAGTNHAFVPGEYGGTGIVARLGNGSNVVADLNRNKDNQNYNLRLMGSAFVDIELLKGLNYRSTVGGTMNSNYAVAYTFATYERSENVATASLNESASYGGDWVWTNTLSLNKTFGQHSINAVAGYEAVKYNMGRNVAGNRAGYFSNNVSFRTLTNGANIVNATSGIRTPVTLVSQFLKADYSLMDKYLLSATVRRDGSSVFGTDTKYGIFPSFSAGWRIGEEAFLDGLPWLSELKIRGSYGTMGNQLPVRGENQFALFGGAAGSSFYDLNGTGSSSLQGFRSTDIRNLDAKWETNVTTNIGFEGGLFDNKITLVFDWYNKQTKELLFNPEIVGTAGAANAPFVNVAEMKNTGIDLELGYKNSFGDLGFNATVVFTTNKNEIVKVDKSTPFFDWGGSRIGNLCRNMEGEAVSSFYGYKVTGLFQDATEVANAPRQDGAAPGFFRYENVLTGNEATDTIIDPGDRQILGNPNPKFTYGLNLGLTYKGLDLSAFFYGSYGGDIYNYNKWWTDFWPSFQGQKSQDLLYNSWTTTNTGASVPKASNTSNFSTNTASTSYYIEDGSYFRLKNLTIGYTIPESIMSKVKIKSLRVYVQAVNLFTITKYSGLDPELGSQTTFNNSSNSNVIDDRSAGIDYGNYPTARQFIFGLNLGL